MFALRFFFIRSVVLCSIHVSRTNAPIGRNATFCSLRYDTSIDNLLDTTLSSHYCFARFQSALSIDLLARDNALREIILVRDQGWKKPRFFTKSF